MIMGIIIDIISDVLLNYYCYYDQYCYYCYESLLLLFWLVFSITIYIYNLCIQLIIYIYKHVCTCMKLVTKGHVLIVSLLVGWFSSRFDGYLAFVYPFISLYPRTVSYISHFPPHWYDWNLIHGFLFPWYPFLVGLFSPHHFWWHVLLWKMEEYL